jgi:hypothetical protein
VRGEAETAGVADRPADPTGVEAAVADLLVDAEGEIVVSPQRRHLLPDEHEHVAVPALLAMTLRRERVVVGEQHHVHLRPRGGARDLAHGACAVRMGGMQVDDAGEVVG